MDVLLDDLQATGAPELDILDVDPTFLQHPSSRHVLQDSTCPDCRCEMPLPFALNLVICSSCGCAFCAKCNALYVVQPGADIQQAIGNGSRLQVSAGDNKLEQQIWTTAAAAEGLLETCRCGAVDKAAIQQKWGSAAIACWPANDLQQQLLLLQLLQQHQQQAVPLLSQQLLFRIQQDWTTAKADVLHWQHVLQAAQAVKHHQTQLKKAPSAEATPSQQQQQQQQPRDTDVQQQVIPTAATPSFKLANSRRSTSAYTQIAMDVDGPGTSLLPDEAPGRLQAEAEAAAVAMRAATASELCNGNHHLQDDMEADTASDSADIHSGHILQRSHQQQHQHQQLTAGLTAAVAAVNDGVVEHQAAQEGWDILALAHNVSAAAPDAENSVQQEPQQYQGEQARWPHGNGVPLPEHVASLPLSMALAVYNGNDSPGPTLAAQDDDMETAEDVVDLGSIWSQPEQQPAVQAAHALPLTDTDQQDHQQRQRDMKSKLLGTENALLRGRGGYQSLVNGLADETPDAVVGDDSHADITQQQAYAKQQVPQLSDFGLTPTGLPVVPDDPVLLIADSSSEQVSLWQPPG